MLYNEIPDIINFVESYSEKIGRQLQGDEIAEFIKQLQQEIADTKRDGARCISNFPAGTLLVT